MIKLLKKTIPYTSLRLNLLVVGEMVLLLLLSLAVMLYFSRQALVDGATDKKVEAELEKLYYTINSSPLRSNEAAKSLERQVLMMLNDLEEATDKEDTLRICDEMVKLANRRNRMLNTNN